MASCQSEWWVPLGGREMHKSLFVLMILWSFIFIVDKTVIFYWPTERFLREAQKLPWITVNLESWQKACIKVISFALFYISLSFKENTGKKIFSSLFYILMKCEKETLWILFNRWRNRQIYLAKSARILEKCLRKDIKVLCYHHPIFCVNYLSFISQPSLAMCPRALFLL